MPRAFEAGGLKVRVALLSPPLVFDARDPFTTGVVYMPIGVAYLAGHLLTAHQVSVLDCFAANPREARRIGHKVQLGVTASQLTRFLEDEQPDVIVIYCNQIANHDAILWMLRVAKQAFTDLPIVVCENTQAVTAYSISELASDFLNAGATAVVAGEAEFHVSAYLEQLQPTRKLTLTQSKSKRIRVAQIEVLDELNFPAWDLFPLESYWDLGYAHGPFTTERYLPILTSRGCPYPCKFCVVPTTNERKWRARSAVNVVDEMEMLQRRFNVGEFHVEDLNPTIDDHRMREIAEEIIARGLHLNWKIVAGTKVETIKTRDTLELLAQSGLSYISMSPESGSARLLREIGKPFDVEHALTIVEASRRLGVKTQACFVVGFPGETDDDRSQTSLLLKKLTRAGLDEVAIFVASPLPGSAIYPDFVGQYETPADLTFSPHWRSDFGVLQKFRLGLYRRFLTEKTLRRPLAVIRQCLNFLTKRFETKMEMVPYRARCYRKLARQARATLPKSATDL